MDPRLNLAMRESHEDDLARHARESGAASPHRWPDDGLPARPVRGQRARPLHPTAVLASLLTWR